MKSLLNKVFKQGKLYLKEEQIIRIVMSYPLSEDEIKDILVNFKNESLNINIDKYYQEHMDNKSFKKLSSSEKVRFIVRNTNINSEYGNFHNIEYHFIIGIVTNELLKLSIPDDTICECVSYMEKHPDERYDGDRFIIHHNRNKSKVAYDNHFYQLSDLFVVYNDDKSYYCTRKLTSSSGEIKFLGNRYYSKVNYDYYDINTKKMICNDMTDSFIIIPLCDIYDVSVNNGLLMFNDVKQRVKQYIKKI